MAQKPPDSYDDLTKDQKALAHWLVDEGELEGRSDEEQKEILFAAWYKDQPGPLM